MEASTTIAQTAMKAMQIQILVDIIEFNFSKATGTADALVKEPTKKLLILLIAYVTKMLYNYLIFHKSVDKIMRLRMLTFLILILLMCTFLIALTVVNIRANPSAPSFPTNSAPYGIPYSDLPKKYWEYQLLIPSAKHPNNGYAPEKCTINQHGPIWFLPDIVQGGEIRSCTIPAGKAILFTIESGQCNYGSDLPAGGNDQDLRRCAVEGNDYAVISASIDGIPLSNPSQYRVQSGYFNLTVPEDNFIGNKPGTWRSYVDGYFILVKPLPPGKHIIEWKDNINNPFKKDYNHSKSLRYEIVVKNP
jgi:hypothetical protein